MTLGVRAAAALTAGYAVVPEKGSPVMHLGQATRSSLNSLDWTDAVSYMGNPVSWGVDWDLKFLFSSTHEAGILAL